NNMKLSNNHLVYFYFLYELAILFIFSIFVDIVIILIFFDMFVLSRILIYYGLAEFNYNKSMIVNLIYYGSYILFGYFTLVAIELLQDRFKTKLNYNPYFKCMTYHLLTISVNNVMSYYCVHIYYS